MFPFFRFSTSFGGDDRSPSGDKFNDIVFFGGTFDIDAIDTIVTAASLSLTNDSALFPNIFGSVDRKSIIY